jgi:hypothetical protein
MCTQIASDGLKGRVFEVSLADLQGVSSHQVPCAAATIVRSLLCYISTRFFVSSSLSDVLAGTRIYTHKHTPDGAPEVNCQEMEAVAIWMMDSVNRGWKNS